MKCRDESVFPKGGSNPTVHRQLRMSMVLTYLEGRVLTQARMNLEDLALREIGQTEQNCYVLPLLEVPRGVRVIKKELRWRRQGLGEGRWGVHVSRGQGLRWVDKDF